MGTVRLRILPSSGQHEERKWSDVNPSLYSVCFKGKALSEPRCRVCASADYAVKDCPFSTKSYIERILEEVISVCAPRAGGGGGGGKVDYRWIYARDIMK